jgi:hypothetical protein
MQSSRQQQITQIEWETEQLKVFDALKSGNQALEEIHKVRFFVLCCAVLCRVACVCVRSCVGKLVYRVYLDKINRVELRESPNGRPIKSTNQPTNQPTTHPLPPHQIMSLEAVEQLMADTQDAIEYEQEVSQLLSANLSSVSEEEVLAEFAALEATLAEPTAAASVAAGAAAAPAPAPAAEAALEEGEGEKPLELPAVPTHALPTVVTAGEEEEGGGRRKEKEKERVAVMTG